jgi:hypothetical protein
MAVSVMARCGPGLGASFGGSRKVRAQPTGACRAPISFIRVARPQVAPTRAFYRGGSCYNYNNWDEESMKVSYCQQLHLSVVVSMHAGIHARLGCGAAIRLEIPTECYTDVHACPCGKDYHTAVGASSSHEHLHVVQVFTNLISITRVHAMTWQHSGATDIIAICTDCC